ncbi:zinc finger protein ZPR1 isoform X2 [Serinus canaria]|nr:zinc finger protein ZPR1 isoform X2 [Serinus canaria]
MHTCVGRARGSPMAVGRAGRGRRGVPAGAGARKDLPGATAALGVGSTREGVSRSSWGLGRGGLGARQGRGWDLPVLEVLSGPWPQTRVPMSLSLLLQGVTRLLLTRIPFFKEIIVSSFSCPSCSWSNTEIQAAGRIQEQGVRYTLAVTSRQDMNREVVKTDCASARIPELDFEVPAFSQKGVLTTIEGIIDRAVAGLEQDQPARRATDKEVARKIDEFIGKLRQLKEVNSPFTFGEEVDAKPPDAAEDLRDEVLQFNTNCPECNAPASTNMKLVQIPHFKEVIIMATNCDSCGHRTNEVKSGGAIEPQGTRITLRITDPSDMTRDILKSETCSVEIPELEFELGMGALGGKFTTLEGLLKDIRDLVEKNPFTLGDSSTASRTGKLQEFIGKLQDIIEGKAQAHFIMDDPAGNSYLQNVYAPEEDPELSVQRYERTFEQNEELGLNDMRTEGYEAEPASGR